MRSGGGNCRMIFMVGLVALGSRAEANPNLFTHWYNKGDTASSPTEQIECFSKAIKHWKSPDGKEMLAKAYLGRAYAYGRKGGPDGVIADCSKALEVKADYAEAFYGRGSAYLEKGNHARAIADFTRTIKLNPDLANLFYNRGYAYAAKGDQDRAIGDYTKALEKNPKDVNTYKNRGYAYYLIGDYGRSIADYGKAIKLKPDDADAFRGRAVGYLYRADYGRAIADSTEAIRLKPDCVLAFHDRGTALYRKGEYNRAILDLRQAIALDRSNPLPVMILGDVYFMMGDLAKALRQVDKALEMRVESTDYAFAYMLKVLILKEQHQTAEIGKVIEKAASHFTSQIRKHPGIAYNYAYLAEIYCEADVKPKEALRLAKKTVELAPNNQYILGFSYYRNGDLPKAIELLEKDHDLNPPWARHLYRLGLFYKEAGENKKARKVWMEALKIDPRHRFILRELGS